MAQAKTYILSPNFTYKPSGPIRLGNIIADPFRPTAILSALPADSQPAIETVRESEFELEDRKDRNIHLGVWGTFLEWIGASVSGEYAINRSRTYTATELETRYLRDEPSEVETALRVAEPAVEAVINAGLFGYQPVYMVTGIKIAKGFSAHNEMSKTWEAGLGRTAPVFGDASVGGELKAGGSEERKLTSRSGNEDIVFAYQLHTINVKGKSGSRTVKTNVLESKAALL
ncbi:hypothetical protein M434DRAFT_63793, partial [Hypoxylon sp. CO27-5]